MTFVWILLQDFSVFMLIDISVPYLIVISVSYWSASLFASGLTGSQQGACMSTAWTDVGSIPLATLDEH